MNPLLIFKTSVTSGTEAARIKPLLDRLLQHPDRWNFDLEDWENILRVDGNSCSPDEIIQLLNEAGFSCEELPD